MATVTKFTPSSHGKVRVLLTEKDNLEYKDEYIKDFVLERNNLKRQLAGTHECVKSLLHDNAELTRRLERSIRKSKGRRRAVKQMEVALLRERAKK